MTRYHERVLRRWAGSFVPHILGESAIPRVITRFFWAIASSIELWEPNYRVTRVRIEQREDGSRLTSVEQLRAGQMSNRIEGGLISPHYAPNPVSGRVLALKEDIFAHDAVILDSPASRSVTYGEPGGRRLKVSWDRGFRELGIWSPPNGDFVCIEPWRGMASFDGFDGEISEKPGIMLIPPGERRKATYKIALL